MRKAIVITAVALVCSLSATAQTTENMDRIEACKQNYRTLFGGEALTGQGTDPEMMDILQKFIFGDVFQTGDLTIKQREMITCITLATMQTLPQLKAHAGAALNVGVTPEELREVMYLTAPFIGFPRMLNAVATVNEVFTERGISLPLEKQGTVKEETRHEAGKAIQDKHYPGGIASVMEGVPGDMGKDVEQFLTDYFFGDIYSRGALDLRTRELLGYCVLTTLEAESQLHSHYHGNITAGNSPEILTAAVIQCLPYIGFPAAIKALRIIKEETADADGKAAFQREMIFPIGEPNTAYAKYFIGNSYLAPISKEQIPFSNVTFEPGCRNNWHIHHATKGGGQMLVCVAGKGWYQEEGKPAVQMLPGDVIHIPANVKHWHGAAADSWFAHLAFEVPGENTSNEWLEPVTDEEYNHDTRRIQGFREDRQAA